MTNALLAVSLISSALRCTALRPHCVSWHRDHPLGPLDLATISTAATPAYFHGVYGRATADRPQQRQRPDAENFGGEVSFRSLPLWFIYSITSSARARIPGGNVSPSALAVLRLTASSNLTGCSTGRSAGLVPCKIRCTYAAARPDRAGSLAP